MRFGFLVNFFALRSGFEMRNDVGFENINFMVIKIVRVHRVRRLLFIFGSFYRVLTVGQIFLPSTRHVSKWSSSESREMMIRIFSKVQKHSFPNNKKDCDRFFINEFCCSNAWTVRVFRTKNRHVCATVRQKLKLLFFSPIFFTLHLLWLYRSLSQISTLSRSPSLPFSSLQTVSKGFVKTLVFS